MFETSTHRLCAAKVILVCRVSIIPLVGDMTRHFALSFFHLFSSGSGSGSGLLLLLLLLLLTSERDCESECDWT
jgi:hypothetical protein